VLVLSCRIQFVRLCCVCCTANSIAINETVLDVWFNEMKLEHSIAFLCLRLNNDFLISLENKALRRFYGEYYSYAFELAVQKSGLCDPPILTHPCTSSVCHNFAQFAMLHRHPLQHRSTSHWNSVFGQYTYLCVVYSSDGAFDRFAVL